jgi:hypothetical protein
VWNVERVGSQVHYISLTVGDQTYNIDTYYSNQPNWTLEEIDAETISRRLSTCGWIRSI